MTLLAGPASGSDTGDRGKAAALEYSARNCPTMHMATLYLTQETGMAPLKLCPKVVFSLERYGPHGVSMDGAGRVETGTTFYPKTGHILLSPQLDLQSPLGFSQLLHQMVHAYQYAHGIDEEVRCREALEVEAYEVQARFLEDSGLDKEAGDMRVLGRLRSICRSRRDPLH